MTRVEPVRILTVCSHNRTRSVMMAAFLESTLGERIGRDCVVVRSGGFGPVGLPAIDEAVEAMRRRDLDVSAHRSGAVTAELLDGADLVLTAERNHVVRITTIVPPAFRRALTLPEFLAAAGQTPPEDALSFADWVESLTVGRTAMAYLHHDIGEVDDPTGWSARAFEAAVVQLERQCLEAAAGIAAALDLIAPSSAQEG